jgi:hypothetical protein
MGDLKHCDTPLYLNKIKAPFSVVKRPSATVQHHPDICVADTETAGSGLVSRHGRLGMYLKMRLCVWPRAIRQKRHEIGIWKCHPSFPVSILRVYPSRTRTWLVALKLRSLRPLL